VKLLHTSDLHLGKKIKNISLLEDQEEALSSILSIAKTNNIDAIILAGDIFDKGVPSVNALNLFQTFLENCKKSDIPVYIIAGNHDDASRISCYTQFFTNSSIKFAKPFSSTPQYNDLKVGNEVVRIHFLPYITPAIVRQEYPEHSEEISSYSDAVKFALSQQPLLQNAPNILIAHQFVIDGQQLPEQSDSENITVGGVDSVDYSLFEDFSYVALGHLHIRQTIGRDTVCYSGSILPYSDSEIKKKDQVLSSVTTNVTAYYAEKTVELVDITNGNIQTQSTPIHTSKAFRKITCSKSSIDEIVNENNICNDYVYVTLTDESFVNAIYYVKEQFPNLFKLTFESPSGKSKKVTTTYEHLSTHNNLLEVITNFIETQQGSELNEDQRNILLSIITELNNSNEEDN
jgi:exonuclease sbcCD, D subunit